MEQEATQLTEETTAATALVRTEAEGHASPKDAGGALNARSLIARLPVQVDVRVPLPSFRVSNLLALALGQVLASDWPTGDDLPLTCGDVHLVWSEFEVVDQKLAVRVTRLV